MISAEPTSMPLDCVRHRLQVILSAYVRSLQRTQGRSRHLASRQLCQVRRSRPRDRPNEHRFFVARLNTSVAIGSLSRGTVVDVEKHIQSDLTEDGRCLTQGAYDRDENRPYVEVRRHLFELRKGFAMLAVILYQEFLDASSERSCRRARNLRCDRGDRYSNATATVTVVDHAGFLLRSCRRSRRILPSDTSVLRLRLMCFAVKPAVYRLFQIEERSCYARH